MCKRVLTVTAFLAPTLVFGQGRALAQNPASDLMEVAVEFIIAEDDLGAYASELTLDPNNLNTPYAEPARNAMTRIPSRLGAQIGRVDGIMRCPQVAPPPDKVIRGYRGCRFIGPTRVLLEVGEPEESGPGFLVWVSTWRLITDPERDSRYIAVASRELELVRGANGEWMVNGVRSQGRARF